MSLREQSPLQKRLYAIIFGIDTSTGRGFDIAIIGLILISVTVVMLDSIASYHDRYGALFFQLEVGFTLLFTIEYLVRIWIAQNRRAYILSTYGVIDLLAILPTYIALIAPEAAPLLVVRLLRVLRVFRILRLVEFLDEANLVAIALRKSARQIFVFFLMIITTMVIFGCLMYVIEGPENGFDNIPVSIYWAIVTITTVGYGDFVPVTAAGRSIAATGMLLGYAIIAVPTGIFTSNLLDKANRKLTVNCPQCARAGHEPDARHCKYCGAALFSEED
ncbi:ion transporter [Pseudohaliea rubra]|uniref:Potassium voltage-gated channel subfamily KQT, possible potassium channel, VIC family n=1 Tax=Pseudohaliea rubra DSM 19751 TaxID=1265313 RepID=A0A095VPS8_9GAMM|nr:ion transporter [Pseudohaliea rubra]KGE03400.1 Potassium voltage-gated channel subfamily KQT, possible potassium channel, VIC family [Pseudohaliea rubra DSM 19751]